MRTSSINRLCSMRSDRRQKSLSIKAERMRDERKLARLARLSGFVQQSASTGD